MADHYATFQAQAAPKPGDKGYREPPQPCDYPPALVAAAMASGAEWWLRNDPGLVKFKQIQGAFEDGIVNWSMIEDFAELVNVPEVRCDGEELTAAQRVALALETVRLMADVVGDKRLRSGKAWRSSTGRHASRTPLTSDGRVPRWAAQAILEDHLQPAARLRVVPVDKSTAAAFIKQHHSHRPEPNWRGVLYTIGAELGGRLVAVATAGTPTGIKGELAKNALELTRIASDGTVPNASSMLAARLLRLAEHSRRGGAKAPWLFVTYQELDEEGATYKALRGMGLRPTSVTERKLKPSGARAGSKAVMGRRIRWEAGPAAKKARWDLVEEVRDASLAGDTLYRRLHGALSACLGREVPFDALRLLRWMEESPQAMQRLLAKRLGKGLRLVTPPVPFPPPAARLNCIDMASGVGMLAMAFQVEGFAVAELCEFVPGKLESATDNLSAFQEDLEERALRAVPDTLRSAMPTGCDANQWHPTMPAGGVHVFSGGPPCQPFSRLGSQQGGDDERDLFMQVPRICAEVRPTVVCMENVEGTQSAKFKEYFDRWWARMAEEGYEGTVWNLRAADFGSASLRPRAFFVAWRKGFEGAAVLREAPAATHATPQTARGKKAIEGGLVPWTRAVDRMNGGCCYGLYSCAKVNNLWGSCESCFDGSNFLEDPADQVEAYPQGPQVDVMLSDGPTWWVRVIYNDDVPQPAYEAVVRTDVYDDSTKSFRAVAEGAPLQAAPLPKDRRGAKPAEVPAWVWRAVLEHNLDGLDGKAWPLVPRRTVERRKIQFRLRPQTIYKQKVLDPHARFTGKLGYYLAPALLHRTYRSMVGTVYTTTSEGYDGIDSMRSASVAQHLRVMDLPTWFMVADPSELAKGTYGEGDPEILEEAFGALGNGVPLLLGQAVARHIWRAFGREPLPPLKQMGLWQPTETAPHCFAGPPVVYLVACVSQKHPGPLAARDLYASDWFAKALTYVELQVRDLNYNHRTQAEWFILSAEHGLLDPYQYIEAYDTTLNGTTVAQRRAWAQKVATKLLARLRQLKAMSGRRPKLVVLAGRNYRDELLPLVREHVSAIEVPMEGLGIGEQKQWLKTNAQPIRW